MEIEGDSKQRETQRHVIVALCSNLIGTCFVVGFKFADQTGLRKHELLQGSFHLFQCIVVTSINFLNLYEIFRWNSKSYDRFKKLMKSTKKLANRKSTSIFSLLRVGFLLQLVMLIMSVRKIEIVPLIAIIMHFMVQNLIQLTISQGDVLVIVFYNLISIMTNYGMQQIYDSIYVHSEASVLNDMAIDTLKISIVQLALLYKCYMEHQLSISHDQKVFVKEVDRILIERIGAKSNLGLLVAKIKSIPCEDVNMSKLLTWMNQGKDTMQSSGSLEHGALKIIFKNKAINNYVNPKEKKQFQEKTIFSLNSFQKLMYLQLVKVIVGEENGQPVKYPMLTILQEVTKKLGQSLDTSSVSEQSESTRIISGGPNETGGSGNCRFSDSRQSEAWNLDQTLKSYIDNLLNCEEPQICGQNNIKNQSVKVTCHISVEKQLLIFIYEKEWKDNKTQAALLSDELLDKDVEMEKSKDSKSDRSFSELVNKQLQSKAKITEEAKVEVSPDKKQEKQKKTKVSNPASKPPTPKKETIKAQPLVIDPQASTGDNQEDGYGRFLQNIQRQNSAGRELQLSPLPQEVGSSQQSQRMRQTPKLGREEESGQRLRQQIKLEKEEEVKIKEQVKKIGQQIGGKTTSMNDYSLDSQEMHLVSQAMQPNTQIQSILLQKKVNSLLQQINTNRIFMNMVIHDMRNPTGSIEFGVQESLKILTQHFDKFQKLKQYFMCYFGSNNSINSEQIQVQNSFQLSQELVRSFVQGNVNSIVIGAQQSIGNRAVNSHQLDRNNNRSLENQVARSLENNVDVSNNRLDLVGMGIGLQMIQQRSNESSIQDVDIIDEDYEIEDENDEANLPKISNAKKGEEVLKQSDEQGNLKIVEKIVFVYPPIKLMLEKGVQSKTQTSNVQVQTDQHFVEERKEERKIAIDGEPVRVRIEEEKLEISSLVNEQIRSRNLNRHPKIKCPKCGTKIIIDLKEHNLSSQDIQMLKEFFESEFIGSVELFLQNSVFSAKMIHNLINDLLDLAKLEKGQFTFNNEYFNLRKTIADGINQVSYMASQKEITIKCEFKDASKQSDQINLNSVNSSMSVSGDAQNIGPVDNLAVMNKIYGDPNRFIQIMQNFLSNALKFTDKGGDITIRVTLMERQMLESVIAKKSRKKALKYAMSENRIQDDCVYRILSDHGLQRQLEQDSMRLQSLMVQNNNSSKAENKQQNQKPVDLVQSLSQSAGESEIPEISRSPANQQEIQWKLPSGSIAVDEEDEDELDGLLDSEENNTYIKLRIQISDTGVGIKKENLPKLFMDFGKLDEHSKINAQGTGLGLSICKRMIEKMGGTVMVDSIEGVGTTFTMLLMMKAKFDSPNQRNLSSQIALEEFKEEQKIQQEIQNVSFQDEIMNSNVKLKSNFVPLHSKISQVSQKSKRVSGKQGSSVPKMMSSQNVDQMACIVANDNSFQLMVVAYNLKSLNIKICKEAVNGLEAFQFAQNCRDKQRIDFVLLDLDMPIMDGFEACQQILGLYTSKNQLFKLEKNNDSDDSDSDRSVVREVEHIIDDMFTKPLMVAYSGLVNEEVEQKAKIAGFDVVIESPLTIPKIQDIILKNLKSKVNKKQKFQIEALSAYRKDELSNPGEQFKKSQSALQLNFEEIPEQCELSQEISRSNSGHEAISNRQVQSRKRKQKNLIKGYLQLQKSRSNSDSDISDQAVNIHKKKKSKSNEGGHIKYVEQKNQPINRREKQKQQKKQK